MAFPAASSTAPKPPSSVLAEQEAQWIFTPAELQNTPSILDGLPPAAEHGLRAKGLHFILQVGLQLKLPQLTLYSASLFFNRFLMRHSLVAPPPPPASNAVVNGNDSRLKPLHHYQIAAIALFLATKTDESVRKMRDIILACCRVAQKNPSLVLDHGSKDFWKWRDTILLNEDVMLETLCFDLSVESPHKLLYELLKILSLEHNKKVRNAAWGFVSDSSVTSLGLLFNGKTIATAAVWVGAAVAEGPEGTNVLKLEDDDKGRPWWKVFDVKIRDVLGAVKFMANEFKDKPIATQTNTDDGTELEGEPRRWLSFIDTPVFDTDDDGDQPTRTRKGGMTPRGDKSDRLQASQGMDRERRTFKRDSEAPSDHEKGAKKLKTRENGANEVSIRTGSKRQASLAGSEEGEVDD